jgi:death-on-curing protein
VTEPRWVSLQIVKVIHLRQLATFGGLGGIRDEGALISAMMRPQNKLAYEPEGCSIPSLAAAYAFGIGMNHPFIDGNKRTAFMTMFTFLRLNGFRVVASEVNAAQMFLSLASGELTEPKLATRIEQHITPVVE